MSRHHTLTLLLSTLVTGCPGGLGDSAPYTSARLDATVSPAPTCPSGVTAEALFASRCATSQCHDDSRSGALDLRASALSRVIGATSMACKSAPLADPKDPDGSLMYLKLFAEPPCGDRMPPQAPALSASEAECVRDWIARGGAPPDAGSADQ